MLLILAEAAAEGVTWTQLIAVIVFLAGIVGFLFRLFLGISDERHKQCSQDRENLIKDHKEKDAKIEKLHTDVRDIVTQALHKSAEADCRLADAVEGLNKGLDENTKTLRTIRCLNQSGQHPAVK